MDRTVYIDKIGTQTRRVLVEDGQPVEYTCMYQGGESLVGNLYLGQVKTVMKGMNAAFVDIGLDKNAFLSLDDLPGDLRGHASLKRKTSTPVKGGDAVLVQVTKEPGGDKGPRVTMNPTFPGQYVVLLPTLQAVGVSRHIQGEEKRLALQRLGEEARPDGMGLILRTAAADVSGSELTAETAELAAEWERITRNYQAQKPPVLIFSSSDLLTGARRDLGVDPICGALPDALETTLEKKLRRSVWLPSGGTLLIDHTEALTVMDVNSSKYTGKKSLADTLLRLNTEAAIEAARQIRLRDLGGILLIDFVDMEADADREAVLAAFREALAPDRAKYHVHGFTAAGLLEITRRPLFRPYRLVECVPCEKCNGEGVVHGVMPQAHALLRDIRRKRTAGDTSVIALRVSDAVAAALSAIGIPENVTISTQLTKE